MIRSALWYALKGGRFKQANLVRLYDINLPEVEHHFPLRAVTECFILLYCWEWNINNLMVVINLSRHSYIINETKYGNQYFWVMNEILFDIEYSKELGMSFPLNMKHGYQKI